MGGNPVQYHFHQFFRFRPRNQGAGVRQELPAEKLRGSQQVLQRFSGGLALQKLAEGGQFFFLNRPVKLRIKSRAVAVQNVGHQVLHGGACLVAALACQILRAGLQNFQ